jgi:Uma2 family endonuclease
MSAVQKFAPHYSVVDYLQWKGDWELWEGVAIAMAPSPFGKHQYIVAELVALLRNSLLQCEATALAELDWLVSDDTVVRPDIMVVCGPPPERHMQSVPGLVVEVLSESTRQNDLTYKRQLYQRERVRYYMMVEPELRSIEIDVCQPSGTYETKRVDTSVELRLCDECQVQFSIESLFSR